VIINEIKAGKHLGVLVNPNGLLIPSQDLSALQDVPKTATATHLWLNDILDKAQNSISQSFGDVAGPDAQASAPAPDTAITYIAGRIVLQDLVAVAEVLEKVTHFKWPRIFGALLASAICHVAVTSVATEGPLAREFLSAGPTLNTLFRIPDNAFSLSIPDPSAAAPPPQAGAAAVPPPSRPIAGSTAIRTLEAPPSQPAASRHLGFTRAHPLGPRSRSGGAPGSLVEWASAPVGYSSCATVGATVGAAVGTPSPTSTRRRVATSPHSYSPPPPSSSHLRQRRRG